MLRHSLLALVFAATLVVAGGIASAHEAVDPVCGMTVSTDDPAVGKTEAGGKAYFFCSESCLATFRADPEKYAATLKVARLSGDERLEAVVTPEKPIAGETIKIALARPEDLASAEATLYRVDRAAPLESSPASFHWLSDGALALQRTLEDGPEWRIRVEAITPDGDRRVATFALPVAPREVNGAANPGAAPGAPLAMAEQHESMRRIGASWAEVGRSLERAADLDRAAASVTAIQRDAALLDRFTLHRHPEAKDELHALGADFRAGLASFARALERRDLGGARESYRRIDVESCTRCHLKFRFGLVSDLRAFPRVRPGPAESAPETPR